MSVNIRGTYKSVVLTGEEMNVKDKSGLSIGRAGIKLQKKGRVLKTS